MSDALKRDLGVCEAATGGPWTIEKPAKDQDGWSHGVIVAAVARGQGVYANPPGGSFPYSDQKFIARSRARWPAALLVVQAVMRQRHFAGDASLNERVIDALQMFEQDDDA
jgi:hypothetical protein